MKLIAISAVAWYIKTTLDHGVFRHNFPEPLNSLLRLSEFEVTSRSNNNTVDGWPSLCFAPRGQLMIKVSASAN